MPAPTSTHEFVDVVRRSGLIPPERLEELIERNQLHDDDPSKIALTLIQEGLLTNFQARQLLRGRYRGFAIGKYLLLEQLGEGGMGKVFLCEHMLMRRRVAIKVLARELASDPGTIERFQREARAVASLDHPNIVRAHDVDQEGDNHFIVMEYVDGTSLHELVRKKGPVEPRRACNFVRQAAIGLQAVTDAGMIHRDIKPGNLLLDRKGVIKVLDLGLARFEQDKRDHITQKFDEGSVLGTADYLSPEQAMNSHEVDIRADIYSLGATLYFLLTGRPPFEGGTVTQKLLFHQLKEPEPLSKLRPDLPAELVAIVEKMMAKDVTRRYQTPQEVADAIAPFAVEPAPIPTEEEMPKLCLAAQRAGTPDALPIPNFPSSSGGAASFSRTTMSSAETPRSMSSTSISKVGSGASAGAPQFDPRRSGVMDKNSSSVVMMGGMSSVGSASRVGLGESSARLNRASASSSALRGRSSRISRRRRRRWPLVTGLLVGLGLLALGGWWLFGGDGGKKKKFQELYVSKTKKGDNYFKSITEAWTKRDPEANGRILVVDPVIEECVRLTGRPGTPMGTWRIEGNVESDQKPTATTTVSRSSASRTPVWKPNAGSNRPLLQVDNVANLQVVRFRLEANDLTDTSAMITGVCPRLALEEIRFDRIRRTGLALVGASGVQATSAMRLSDMTFYPGSTDSVGMLLEASSQNPGPVRHLDALSLDFARGTGEFKNLRLKIAVQISVATQDVQFKSSTFTGAETAFAFKKTDAPWQPFDVALTRCEFKQCDVGLRFDSMDKGDRNQLSLTNCYFFEVPRVATLDEFHPEPVVQAKWIWSQDAGQARPDGTVVHPAGTRYFRYRFPFKNQGQRVYLNASCDDRCSLWLNGKKLKDIPPEYSQHSRVDSQEITRDLKDGENVLAVAAENLAQKDKPTPAGLLVQLTSDGGNLAPPLVSDASWRCTDKATDNWFEPGFSDASWKPVRVLGDYAGSTVPWKQLVWDSEVRTRFGRVYSPVIKAEGNARDYESQEGYPNLATTRKTAIEMEQELRPTRDSASATSGRTLPLPGFLFAGPFDAKFDESFPPETNPSPSMAYVGREGEPVNWFRHSVANANFNLRDKFDLEEVTVYAMTWISSPGDQDGELHIAFDDAAKVWLNGELILSKNILRAVVDPPEVVKVRLNKGLNKLLVKVINRKGDFGFKISAKADTALQYMTRHEGADKIKGGYLPGDSEKYDK